MKDTIIVSGGDIQRDFALDFLRNRIERIGREKLCLIAADRGLEFFMENHLLPDVAVGDFDVHAIFPSSVSSSFAGYLSLDWIINRVPDSYVTLACSSCISLLTVSPQSNRLRS